METTCDTTATGKVDMSLDKVGIWYVLDTHSLSLLPQASARSFGSLGGQHRPTQRCMLVGRGAFQKSSGSDLLFVNP